MTAAGEAQTTEAPPPPVYAQLLPGDRLPSMCAPCAGVQTFAFDVHAGHYHLLGFFLSAEAQQVREALAALRARREMFDDVHCSFTGVFIDAGERQAHGLIDAFPGLRFAWDQDWAMSRACGAIPRDARPGQPTTVRRCWVLVDPSLHVLKVFPLNQTAPEAVLDYLAALPPPDRFGGVSRPAPILMLPNVFEPEFCRQLIQLYQAQGGGESGLFRGGNSVLDSSFKRRQDCVISDPGLIRQLNARISRRVAPEIERLFFMRANYIERHIIGCYSAADGGHFSPHLDNGPGASAHRRFAISVNLTDDFEGGELVFPEYGMQPYKAPAGWAVVFPAGILHGVRKVTRGERYCFLPFVYDESGRAIRDAEQAKAAAATAAAP